MTDNKQRSMTEREYWRNQRELKRISQQEIATFLGCSSQHINQWELKEDYEMSLDKVSGYMDYIEGDIGKSNNKNESAVKDKDSDVKKLSELEVRTIKETYLNQLMDAKKIATKLNIPLATVNKVIKDESNLFKEIKVEPVDFYAGNHFTGKSIKMLRRRLKLSQNDIAQYLSVSKQIVLIWEKVDAVIDEKHNDLLKELVNIFNLEDLKT